MGSSLDRETERKSPLRVLVVDDHALIREGLISLLSSQPDIEVVGAAGDGQEALAMAQEVRPDLVLMDVSMPGMDGLEATRQMHEALPGCKVVMLTEGEDDDRWFQAVQNGALGYVNKSTATQNLIPTLRRVMRGEAALSGAMAVRILDAFRELSEQAANCPLDEELPVLTAREREVLRRVADGAMDREIADQLSISLSTVKTHVRNILAKLHATSRHQAALMAMRQGLIRPPDQGEI
jgi:two-component system nitrate/nitrite response regulator NarL